METYEEYDAFLLRRNRIAQFITGKPRWQVSVEQGNIKQTADSDTVKGAWSGVCAGISLFAGITIESPCPWDENGAMVVPEPDVTN